MIFNSKTRIKIVIFSSIIILTSLNSFAAELSLDEYLNQVRTQHLGLAGSRETSEGALQAAEESKLIFRPQAFGQITYKDDQKENASKYSMGDRTQAQIYSLGVAQQFSFGLQTKLSYVVNHVDIRGTGGPIVLSPTFTLPAPLAQPNYWEGGPVLEITQPFLRNGFGSEFRAQSDAAEAQALATSYGESFKTKAILTEAELSYWRLALARESVRAQKEVLGRAQKLRDWSTRRVSLSLTDRADLLQSDAALKLRQLEYESAINDEKATAELFNSTRGIKSDQVEEKLLNLSPNLIAAIKIPSREGMRDDVKAALEVEKASAAANQLAIERNRAKLDIFASVALNKRADTFSAANSQPLSTEHPTTTVGLVFSTPLDFGTIERNRAAYRQEKRGAELNYQRKLLDQEVDWISLTRKLEEAKTRFAQARELEAIQQEKITNERSRLQKGRSSTFTVLQFENDYITAELSRIKLAADVLRIYAQLKTYGASK